MIGNPCPSCPPWTRAEGAAAPSTPSIGVPNLENSILAPRSKIPGTTPAALQALPVAPSLASPIAVLARVSLKDL